MPIQIAQSREPAGKDHWRWSVWLNAPDAELDGVDHVVYTLHSTFSEPVRRVSDRASRFRLDSSGWGEFTIHAAVHHRGGRVEKLEHWLTLSSDVDQWLKRGSGTVPRARERGVPRPRIYLSYSVADAAIAKAIVPLLSQEGVEVTTSGEIGDTHPEMPFEQLILVQLRAVSRAVFLISGYSSPWVKREAEAALSLGVPRAFVTIGDSAPPDEDMTSLWVKGLEPDNAREVAQTIARWAHGSP